MTTIPQALHVHHATIVVPQHGEHFFGQLLVHQGKIAAMYRHQDPIEKPENTHTINANGAILTCGLVDIGVCTPHPTHGGSALNKLMAQAATSGITTMAVLPHAACPLDELEPLQTLRSIPKDTQPLLFPIASMYRKCTTRTAQQMNNIGTLIQAGARATLIDPWPQDLSFALNLLRYAQSFQRFKAGLWVNPLHADFMNQASVHSGTIADRLGLVGISRVAETAVLATLHEILTEHSDVLSKNLHFSHISCARSASLIKMWASQKNLSTSVTAGIPVMNLQFNETAILGNASHEQRFNRSYDVLPPLRTETDRQALGDALAEDLRHAGTHNNAKTKGDTMGKFLVHSNHRQTLLENTSVPFDTGSAGGGNITTLLDGMAHFAQTHQLTPAEWLPAITYRPAKVLNLPEHLGIGCLAVDRPAHLCLFAPCDPKRKSGGHYTQVKATVINGHLVYEST